MNVLHISTSDIRGGAALAAYSLHQAMVKRQDFTSSMLVRYKESQDPTVVKIRLSTSLMQRVRRSLGRELVNRDKERYSQPLSKVELFSDDRGAWTESVVANVSGFDVIQLHWICDFLNYRRFFKDVPKEVPLVWRLSDMNPLTGGCHYAGDCARFEKACGCCPMLESQREHDWSRAIWKRKKAALGQLSSERLHIVALNRWMADQVRRSSLLGRFECSVIPNGVNFEEFRPIQPTVARDALGIPGARRVVAFVADSVSNVRKGFPLLVEALNSLGTRRNLFLLAVGQASQLLPTSFPSLQVGHVLSASFLRLVYSAADVFVIPSLEDNQPNTVLEAMACGTPVAGFKVGGIPEIVEEGRTGLLSPRGSVRELARSIEFLLDHDQERAAMALHARRRVEEVFSRDVQVQKYLDLYSGLVARREAKAKSLTQLHPDFSSANPSPSGQLTREQATRNVA
jgi:glycosyltransferase involved in cell wall biosynthesis